MGNSKQKIRKSINKKSIAFISVVVLIIFILLYKNPYHNSSEWEFDSV